MDTRPNSGKRGGFRERLIDGTWAGHVAEHVADELSKRLGFPRERIWVRETGAVLSVHAGPGVVGVMAVPQARAT